MTINFENGTIYRNVGSLVFGNRVGAPKKLHLITVRDGRSVTETVEYSEGSGEYQWESFFRAISGELIETPADVVAKGIRIVNAMAAAERNWKEHFQKISASSQVVSRNTRNRTILVGQAAGAP